MNSVPRESLSREAIKNYDMVKSQSGKGMDYSMLLRAPNDLDTLRNYYAQISMVDDGVGEIISTLDDLSLMDDTLFIFTADHGLSVGQHGFWGHGAATFPSNLHKAAHSVPMIIRNGDETKIGQRSDLMVSNMDIFSTILDVTKIEQIDDSENDIVPPLNFQFLFYVKVCFIFEKSLPFECSLAVLLDGLKVIQIWRVFEIKQLRYFRGNLFEIMYLD